MSVHVHHRRGVLVVVPEKLPGGVPRLVDVEVVYPAEKRRRGLLELLDGVGRDAPGRPAVEVDQPHVTQEVLHRVPADPDVLDRAERRIERLRVVYPAQNRVQRVVSTPSVDVPVEATSEPGVFVSQMIHADDAERVEAGRPEPLRRDRFGLRQSPPVLHDSVIEGVLPGHERGEARIRRVRHGTRRLEGGAVVVEIRERRTQTRLDPLAEPVGAQAIDRDEQNVTDLAHRLDCRSRDP